MPVSRGITPHFVAQWLRSSPAVSSARMPTRVRRRTAPTTARMRSADTPSRCRGISPRRGAFSGSPSPSCGSSMLTIDLDDPVKLLKLYGPHRRLFLGPHRALIPNFSASSVHHSHPHCRHSPEVNGCGVLGVLLKCSVCQNRVRLNRTSRWTERCFSFGAQPMSRWRSARTRCRPLRGKW